MRLRDGDHATPARRASHEHGHPARHIRGCLVCAVATSPPVSAPLGMGPGALDLRVRMPARPDPGLASPDVSAMGLLAAPVGTGCGMVCLLTPGL